MTAWDRVFFQELDNERRKVVLAASEAPHGHFRGEAAIRGLGRELRRSRQEIPGSRTPSISVNGSRLKDLTLHIHARDSLTGQRGRALELINTIDSIAADARLLRLVWGSKIYNALILDFDPEGEAEGEFTATITFERYEIPRRRPVAPPTLALPSAAGDLLDSIETSRTSFRKVFGIADTDAVTGLTVPTIAVPGLNLNLGQTIEQLFTAVTSPAVALLSLAEDIEAGVSDVADALRQAANMAAALMRRARELAAFLSAQDDPDDAGAAAAWARTRADALVAIQQIAVDAQKLGYAAESKAQGKAGGKTYTTRSGDTLEDLAARFATSVEKLLALNPSLTGGPLPEGLKIKLP